MANKFNTYKVVIDGEDVTRHVPFPIKWQKLLDEQLDITRISMKRMPQKIIHPLTPASVTMTDKRDNVISIPAVITTDSTTEVPLGSGTYNHEVFMLEETKILEGIVVDALTFTNDLGRNYAENAVTVNPDVNNKGEAFTLANVKSFKTPILIGESFTFPSIADVFGITTFVDDNKMTISRNNDVIFSSNAVNKVSGDTLVGQVSYTAKLEEGEYKAVYYAHRNSSIGKDYETTVTYTFHVVENRDPLPRWNIASVIDRVLDVAEPHLDGIAPRFKLNAVQAAKFAEIEAPEFAFTNSTLREVLNQIGGYIHGMPRLIGNEIYFDMYGGTKQAKLYTDKIPYASNTYSQDVESYCTGLDSTVDNMVCLTDPVQGSITDPYYNGYKTVRAEDTYVRVAEGNMFISTQYPIQEIRSLKLYYNGHYAVITPYVFENAEYSRQSSYDGAYPYSKSYALYYTQGEKNIYGLNFKVPDVTGGVLSKYSIVNIYNEATGLSESSLTYQALSFQVEYIPVFSAHVQQTKQYIGGAKQPRTLVYNQGANLIETRYFGENMKGAVARMGNVDRSLTYNLSDFSYIPEPGEMYGEDYYISSVTCELYPDYVKCVVELSEDFNRLSQYIGINSVRRFYEVSEKAAYQRDIKYADYVVIGDSVEQDETLTSIDNIVDVFSQASESHSISHMIAQGYTESGGEASEKVILPIVSTAQGNAMIFTANYKNNYSAGDQVQTDSSGSVSGYFTNAVPYADYYGRIHSLQFALYNSGISLDLFNRQAYALPQYRNLSGTAIIKTDSNKLIVRKDGSEILSLNYVLEFVTNKRNYIIGSAFARNCPLVRGTDTSRLAALYVLPNRLGKFASTVDLSGATKIGDYTGGAGITVNGKSAKFSDFTPTVGGLAWAIIDQSSGELLIGSNEVIKSGTRVLMPYMTLRHDIFNLGGK